MGNEENKYCGFSLPSVLIIVVITSIVSALTAGIIVYNNNKITSKVSYLDLAKDEELNQFLEVYANIVSDYYQDIDKKELVAKAISAMMNYLGDDYTTYMDDEETDSLLNDLIGEYKGIGVSINNNDKSIVEVFDDTPAFKANILVGDIIVGINDIDVSEKNGAEVVDIIKEQNGNFTMHLIRDGQPLEVTLKSEKILSPNVTSKVIEGTKTGYMQISTFSATLDKQVKRDLQKLEAQGIENLVIDLRDNTGGYLDAAIDVASMFTKKGEKIFSLAYKDELTDYVDETQECRNYKIVILVNGRTASASEILAATLKEDYGATIVGTLTFGKGKVQQTMKLEDGGMVKYTSAYWLTPNGNNIDKVGIAPDYSVENENVYDENGIIIDIIDRQLEEALRVINE